MRTIGNLLWHFPFFGFVTAICVYILGLLLTITVIAAPIGIGLMEFGKFLFWPFGNRMVSKSKLNARQNLLWKSYSTIIMILYFPIGLILFVLAFIQVVGLMISIVGIPPALVIFKSLGVYLNPVNKKCISSVALDEIERRNAHSHFV